MNNVDSKLPLKQPCISRRAKKWNYRPFQIVCCVGTPGLQKIKHVEAENA
jgi:hypothetical protein